MGEIVGITSTIPIEVIYASGNIALDLNNLFFSSRNRENLISEAELKGLPANICGWIKGIFGITLAENVKRVVYVSEGDCTGSRLMAEFLYEMGVDVYGFSYPIDGDRDVLKKEIEDFCRYFGIKLGDAEKKFKEFRIIREKLMEIDRLTYLENRVSGFENFLYLISGSDMEGDPVKFSKKIDDFLKRVKKRKGKFKNKLRVGIIGVPTLLINFYDVIEVLGGQVVFNETSRQFSLSFESDNLIDAYLKYTYPYDVEKRIADIKREIERREIDCIIHNVQSFCFHNFEDEIFRENLPIPILKIESNLPVKMAERDVIRVENFFNSMVKKQFEISESNSGKINSKSKIKLGFDFGSRWVKVVALSGKKLFFRKKIDTVKFYGKYCFRDGNGIKLNLELFLKDFLPDVDGNIFVGATGYGKGVISRMDGVNIVPEIIAHSKGAMFLSGELNFTLLDIGGQDTKVALVRDGRLVDFKMNDKCAAGSGRYIENIAKILGVRLSEFGRYWEGGVHISSICATFGESEVISRVAEGYSIPEICAGVNGAVVRRILPDLVKFKSDILIMSGGIVKNRAIFKLIEREGLFKKILVLKNGEFSGAIGTII